MSEHANVKSPLISDAGSSNSSSNGSGQGKGRGKANGKGAKAPPSSAVPQAVDSDDVSVTIPDRTAVLGGVASDEYEGDEKEEEERKSAAAAAPSLDISSALSPRSAAAIQNGTSSHATSPPPNSTVMNAEDIDAREEFLKIDHMVGYEFSWLRELRYWLGVLCSAFVLFLLNLWFPERFVAWRYRAVPLDEAQYVHVFGKLHGAELVPVEELGHDVAAAMHAEDEHSLHQQSPIQRRNSMDLLHAGHRGRMMIFRHMRYIYSPSSQTFVLQQADAVNKRVESQAADQRHTSVAGLKAKELNERLRIGLTREQWLDNLVLYGENALLLEVPSIPRLLFTEVFHPFYVFQVSRRSHARR